MRLTFDISDETAEILHAHLPHGSRKYIYKALVEGLAYKLQHDRLSTLSSLVTKTWNINEFVMLSQKDT